MSATTPMLWVMSRIPVFSFSFSDRSRSRMSACTVTSRAVVGSSAMITSGSQASAMAITTRCRMPPDSSWGYCLTRRSAFGMPTALSRSMAFCHASAPWATLCTSIDSVSCSPILMTGLRAVIGSWKTMATRLPRRPRSCRGVSFEMALSATIVSPVIRAVFGSSPRAVVAVTDLPEPDSPTRATTSPGLTARETPLTAWTRPNSVRKLTSSSWNWSTDSVSWVGGIVSFTSVLICFFPLNPSAAAGRRRHAGRRR